MVDLSASDATANFALAARVLPFGLSCTSAPVNFVTVTRKIPLGNKTIATKKVTLAFPFSFGGVSDPSVLISTSGRIDLLPHGWRASNTTNETTIEVVNAVQRETNSDSNVFYGVSGTKPNRVFVAEWRDLDASSAGNHLTYEAQLHENGDVDLVYTSIPPGIDDTPRTLARNTNQPNPPFFVFAPRAGDDPPLNGVAMHLSASSSPEN